MSKFIKISELSKILNLEHPKTKKPLNHILRYWEKEFKDGTSCKTWNAFVCEFKRYNFIFPL